jgi:hypothetical protein
MIDRPDCVGGIGDKNFKKIGEFLQNRSTFLRNYASYLLSVRFPHRVSHQRFDW